MRARAAGLVLWVGTLAWAGGGEEEVDLDALEKSDPKPIVMKNAPTRVPEHDYDRKLLVFPVLLIALLAWNVKWK